MGGPGVAASPVWTLRLCSICMLCSKYMDLSLFLVWNRNIVLEIEHQSQIIWSTRQQYNLLATLYLARRWLLSLQCIVSPPESDRWWMNWWGSCSLSAFIWRCDINSIVIQHYYDKLITIAFNSLWLTMCCESQRTRYLGDNWWEYCSCSITIQRDDINFIAMQH